MISVGLNCVQNEKGIRAAGDRRVIAHAPRRCTDSKQMCADNVYWSLRVNGRRVSAGQGGAADRAAVAPLWHFCRGKLLNFSGSLHLVIAPVGRGCSSRTQCRLNVGLASQTMVQRWANVVLTIRKQKSLTRGWFNVGPPLYEIVWQ